MITTTTQDNQLIITGSILEDPETVSEGEGKSRAKKLIFLPNFFLPVTGSRGWSESGLVNSFCLFSTICQIQCPDRPGSGDLEDLT